MAETLLLAAGASAATASTVGSVITGAGALAGLAGSVASLASVGSSLGNAGLQIAGSQQQAAALETQAQQVQIQAQAERLRGQAQANQTRTLLLRTLSAQNARYAAAGLDATEGTPQALAEETQYQAALELGLIDTNSQLAALGRESDAAALRTRARDTRSTGQWRAGLSLFDAVDRLGQRSRGTVSKAGAIDQMATVE